MIYCIGNSHANFFTGTHPKTSKMWSGPLERFFSYSVGPIIAYNFMDSHMEKTLEALG